MGVEIACAQCGVSYDSEAHSTSPASEEKRAAELERMRNRRRVDQHAPARPAVCECPACREFVVNSRLNCATNVRVIVHHFAVAVCPSEPQLWAGLLWVS